MAGAAIQPGVGRRVDHGHIGIGQRESLVSDKMLEALVVPGQFANQHVAAEGSGLPAGLRESLGHGFELIGNHGAPDDDIVSRWQETREQGGDAGLSPGRGGVGPGEGRRLCRELVQSGAGGQWVSILGQMIRPQGVDHDQHDVRRGRRSAAGAQKAAQEDTCSQDPGSKGCEWKTHQNEKACSRSRIRALEPSRPMDSLTVPGGIYWAAKAA